MSGLINTIDVVLGHVSLKLHGRRPEITLEGSSPVAGGRGRWWVVVKGARGAGPTVGSSVTRGSRSWTGSRTQGHMHGSQRCRHLSLSVCMHSREVVSESGVAGVTRVAGVTGG